MQTTYVRLNASGVVAPGAAQLAGFYVANTSSGTLVLYDSASGQNTPMTGTITPAIGFHNMMNVSGSAGIFADFGTLGVGAMDVTFFVKIAD